MQFKDQLNDVFELQKTPKRIVCLVPSITELLADLGLTSSIVGITKFCVHPSSLRKEKIIIGGTKNIKFEKIKNLQPDFIICNKEENTKEIVDFCKEVTTTFVSDIYTIEDTLQLINIFGEIFACQKNAIEISNKITKEKNFFLKSISNAKKKRVAYFIWKDPWMVAAKNTFINHLLNVNNFDNVYKDKNRYPEVTISELEKIKNLDCIFLSSEPFPFKEKHINFLKEKFNETTIILVDGEYFSWYGSKLMFAFKYFKELRLKLK
jgi:ABC-type Fe3+-hydroxamate transport system substrate-binding protein